MKCRTYKIEFFFKIINESIQKNRYKMSLSRWIQPYEEYIEMEYLAVNPNPQLIPYLKENEYMIDWSNLSKNPNAIDMLYESNCIDWKNLCLNLHPKAIELIKEHHAYYVKRWKEKARRTPYDMVLSWENLSQNPSAIDFLREIPLYRDWRFQEPPYEANQDDYGYESEYLNNLYIDNEIHWGFLSNNPKAIKLLKENPEKIDWSWLSSNTSKKAIQLLKENQEKIDWYWLSQNPKAIEIIEENLDKANWPQLCKNPKAIHLFESDDTNIIEVDWTYLSANPNAIHILEQYREKIDWRWLCKNPNAGKYLEENIEKNLDKLDWQWLSENPCIFE